MAFSLGKAMDPVAAQTLHKHEPARTEPSSESPSNEKTMVVTMRNSSVMKATCALSWVFENCLEMTLLTGLGE